MSTENKGLPELPDDAVDRIEKNVFSEIARDRVARSRGTRTRRRWVGGGIAAAAVVAAALVVTPMMLQGGGSLQADAERVESGAAPDSAAGGDASAVDEAAPEETDGDTERRVIRTGYATLVVDDILGATEELTHLAAELDGYVESLGSSSADEAEVTEATRGQVTLRIPAKDLDGARASLADIGDVVSIEVSEDDVTSQAIDLEARIDSLQGSVDRLTDLMDQAGSVGDLLEAESALSERQAQLESYQRELEHLDDQVAMSTLHVELTRDREAASTDPAGFSDGLLTGWNGLVGFVNGFVVAVGFLLPWLGVLGAAALVVWLAVRLIRRR